MLLGRGEHIEDASPHGDLPASLDEVHALVAQLDQRLDELVQWSFIPDRESHRQHIGETDHHRLEEGTHGCHDDIDRLAQGVLRIGVGQSAHERHPPTHRVQ